MSRARTFLKCVAAPLALVAGLGAASASPCERAGAEAEHAFGLPNGLLLAIGRVESGRWDRALGRLVPWPWTINQAGAGQLVETKEDAVRLTRSALASGQRNIDVGCFQVNLLHHPNAFTTLDEAFDPVSNARYAARFLTDLRARAGSWAGAVEAYHSANPARAIPYGRAVRERWMEAAGAPAAEAPITRYGIRVWTPSAPGTAPSMVKIEAAVPARPR